MKQFPSLAASAMAIFLSLAVSCCSPIAPDAKAGNGEPLLIMSWNVLSLFDPIDDGDEYAEYSVERGTWSEARYRARLSALAEVILRAGDSARRGPPGPDILCLVEIEKKSILDDLAKGPLAKCGYRHRAFAKAEGSAIGLGILSRLPLESARAWGLVLGGGRERPILEARFSKSGQPFAVLVNHWKSKLEGAEVTEASRIESARLLSRIVAEGKAGSPGLVAVACGDFNENPDEQARIGGRYQTAFMPAAVAVPGSVGLAGRGSLVAAEAADIEAIGSFVGFSPWDDSEGYSYSHRGNRERIDGFVLSPELLDGRGLDYLGFEVLDEGLVDDSGVPIPWSNFKASGWSDHLPILLELVERGIGS
jgi:endonuclease/exonuclease/phosphatase family metal-dependent hydrolase